MDNPAFDWNHARAFLAAAEAGSYSGGARALGLTQPTLGRQVAALEQQLQVILFERVARGLILTQAGHDLLEHMRAMGTAAGKIALIAQGRSQSIEGRVRITASDTLSAYILPPVLKEMRKAFPLIEFDVVAANDIRDLLRREADIAIRHVRPEQPDLIARQVREGTAHFYAASDYLEARGRPRSKADLAQHDFVGFGDIDRMLSYITPWGLPIRHDNFRIGSENGIVAWELVRRGFGIGPMGDDIASLAPEVERVLPDMEPITFPYWLTTHRELHTSRRIRVVFDMLADFLARHSPHSIKGADQAP